ncbi:MAG: PadR family transcriptional regulator [Pseudonocardia sp.]|nr:PadR family transcriptional regulator [Pseudonocardia sp.]
MSLSHALLGLLAVEPRSGYELTQAFKGDLGRYAWQAGHTSIYPELAKLADRGLVEVTEEGPRGSRTYSVTPQGHTELRSWMLDPPRRGTVRNEPVLRMFLISALDPADALVLLHGIAEHTATESTNLRRTVRDIPATIPAGPEGFGHLAAEYGIRQFDAVHDWALWAIETLQGQADTKQA